MGTRARADKDLASSLHVVGAVLDDPLALSALGTGLAQHRFCPALSTRFRLLHFISPEVGDALGISYIVGASARKYFS
jgi:hypothetical protein